MFPGFLVEIIILLIVIGLLLWLVNILPIDAQIKQIIKVIVVVVIVIWLLYLLVGLMPAHPPGRLFGLLID